jgi:hypothetical protein
VRLLSVTGRDEIVLDETVAEGRAGGRDVSSGGMTGSRCHPLRTVGEMGVPTSCSPQDWIMFGGAVGPRLVPQRKGLLTIETASGDRDRFGTLPPARCLHVGLHAIPAHLLRTCNSGRSPSAIVDFGLCLSSRR